MSSGKIQKNIQQNNYKKSYIPMLIISITVIFIYLPAFKNDFVNLDDPGYIIKNDVIKSISWDNIKHIFSKSYMGNYHPLTMLSYMIEYKIAGLNPFIYHLTNIILHIFNSILVYIILNKLTNFYIISLITALLFGLHPMKVESVAWISERKDVLYSFFFLLSMNYYLNYLEKKSLKNKLYILLFFLLSLLSKAQAVVLPLVLLLIDYYKNNKPYLNALINKVPYFVFSIIFGIIAILAQKHEGAIQPFYYFDFEQRILFSAYALLFYLYKIIIPANLSCYYPYPVDSNDIISNRFVFISPLILIILTFLTYKYLRKHREHIFGILFFLVNIILLTQLIPVGDAICADRYTYMASTGLFFSIVHFVFNTKNKFTKFLFFAYLSILAYLSYEQTKIWKDSITLYTNAINNNYQHSLLFTNRSSAYFDKSNYIAALQDIDEAIKLLPSKPSKEAIAKLYKNKAMILEKLGDFKNAINYFSEAIKYSPNDVELYLKRGNLFLYLNEFENSVYDFKKVTKLVPDKPDGYCACVEPLARISKIDEAFLYVNKCIELSPNDYKAYNNKGLIYLMKENYNEAIENFTKSINLNPEHYIAYKNRAKAYIKSGKYREALNDLIFLRNKGYKIDEEMLKQLNYILNKK